MRILAGEVFVYICEHQQLTADSRRHRDDPHESSSHAKKRDPSIDQVTSRFSGLDFGPSHPADRHTALPPTKKSSHVQYPQATGYGPGQPTPPQQSGSGELPPKRPDAPYGAGGGYGQRSGRSNTVGSGGTKGDEATGVPSEDAWKCMSDRSAAYGPSKDPAVDFARGNVSHKLLFAFLPLTHCCTGGGIS